ncbi:MAG: sodium:proton antiporter, partial [Nannocystaceae bacterium]
LAFGLVSRRLDGSVLTPPLAFVLIGFLLGADGLNLLAIPPGHQAIHLLAEITLVLVLFADASRIDLRALRRELGIPVRLLGVGLPLTIALGAVVAKLVLPELSVWEAATLGAVLAPTDAALGQAVVSSPKVPLRIRQALNVESGLNDGVALPVVMIFAALAGAGSDARAPGEWLAFWGLQVTLGPAVGVAVAYAGGRLLDLALRRAWMNESFAQLSGLSLALLAFTVAEAIGGNGFIAAFVGGMVLGNTARESSAAIHEFLEAEGQLLMLLVFMVFGAMFAWPALQDADGPTILYAALSLTLIRMIPVALSLLGARLRLSTVLFLGWFGPRGLATVLFGLLILESCGAAHRAGLFTVAMVTVVFSVVAHGVTAGPGAALYAQLVGGSDAGAAEREQVQGHPTRRSADPDA